MKREQLLLDLIGCQKGLGKLELWAAFATIPAQIGMQVLTEPLFVEGTIRLGYTGFVIIEESHIAIHTFTEEKLVWVDICSCRPFDATEVKAYLVELFDPDEVKESEVR